MTSRLAAPAVFLLLLCLSLVLIHLGGGFHADAAGDPDEPAHAVTSLMVRDFMVSGQWTDPGSFAKNYYRDFPKIAIGHYPPVYYVVASGPLLIHPAIGTLIALQAVWVAALGTIVFLTGRKILGGVAGLAAALLTALLPLILKLSLLVMADLLLVTLCLVAVLCWSRYLEKPAVKTALLFGVIAALAILTKGSGLMLALVPPITVVLRGEWRMLRSWSWWCAALPVVLLAGPWLAMTAGITKEGMTGQSTLSFLASALAYYGENLPRTFGYAWLALALVGVLAWLRQAWRNGFGTLEASLLAALGGAAAVILLVPAGLSDRYLAPVAPILAILAVAGAIRIAQLLPERVRPLTTGALAALALAPIASLPQKNVSGFAHAVAHAQSAPRTKPSAPSEPEVWLVSSDPRGEGGVIAEAAFRLESRSPSPLRVYRAGKELATSDWLGRGYKAAFTTENALLIQLDTLNVQWVFVDLSVPEHRRVPHEALLEKAMAGAPDRWTLAFRQPVVRQAGVTGELLAYRSVARSQTR